jgi:arginyl-tRNA synthetase
MRYQFLKVKVGGDVVFDINEAVGLTGNTGSYLQYAHARARSILKKVIDDKIVTTKAVELELAERSLLRKIGEYAEVVERATDELMPHHVCVYLYELAQAFNRFYEHNRVIDDPREGQRVKLVGLYAQTLKKGLELLGIHAPEKM